MECVDDLLATKTGKDSRAVEPRVRMTYPHCAHEVFTMSGRQNMKSGRCWCNVSTPRTGRRMLCQALNAEYAPKGIHVAHVIVDGVVAVCSCRVDSCHLLFAVRLLLPCRLLSSAHLKTPFFDVSLSVSQAPWTRQTLLARCSDRLPSSGCARHVGWKRFDACWRWHDCARALVWQTALNTLLRTRLPALVGSAAMVDAVAAIGSQWRLRASLWSRREFAFTLAQDLPHQVLSCIISSRTASSSLAAWPTLTSTLLRSTVLPGRLNVG